MSVTTLSPIALSYAAALRGIKPRQPGDAFIYAAVNCQTPDLLIGLAASNPEGRFYGLCSDPALCAKASEEANKRGVSNVGFLKSGPREVLTELERNPTLLPQLNYLVCDESEQPLPPADRQALYDLAAKKLQPGGLFAYNYRAYADADGALRFLVRELAPEMNGDQACKFLLELKKLGGVYFKDHGVLASRLNQAIVKNMPDEFFALFDQGEARAASFDTIVALRPRGFIYAGDSKIPANYIELSVPAEAQQIILDCRESHLYEPVKDFAFNRAVRSDIWCRQPAAMSAEPAQLFGGFSYGIMMPRDKVPASIDGQGKTIPLDAPLYTMLIDLMTLMPVSVGDIMAHPSGKDYAAADIVGAIHILAACGLARPMRGVSKANHLDNISQPRLVGSFNQYLDKMSLTGATLSLASPVMGDVVTVSPRDALVMQALDRGGLANSVSALLPELQRLSRNPAQAASVMDVAEPTAETAHRMITDAVTHSIVQWYAYGLLEAA